MNTHRGKANNYGYDGGEYEIPSTYDELTDTPRNIADELGFEKANSISDQMLRKRLFVIGGRLTCI
jgi:hypothetical protein